VCFARRLEADSFNSTQLKEFAMKYTLFRLNVALTACATLMCSSAFAGRPFFTEDAAVLEKSVCEWESVAARASADGSASATQVTTQLGCGVGSLGGIATQLAAGVGQSRSGGVTDKSHWLSGKSGWTSAGDTPLMLAVAYGANWSRPDGATSGLETVFVNGVATQALAGKVTGHLNLGWVGNRPAQLNSTNWNAGLEYAVTDTVDVGAELFGVEHANAFVGAGARWAVNKSFSLNAGYAVQSGGDRHRLGSLGIKLTF
jgi:hypothetical protein